MAGPFPVVGIPAEFAHAFGGCPYEAYIFVHVIHVEQVLPTAENGYYDRCLKLIAPAGFRCYFLGCFVHLAGFVGTRGIPKGFLHAGSYIVNAAQEAHRKAFGIDFLAFVGGPEAIAQVVVLDTGR